MKEYAMYKGDKLLATGTLFQLSEKLNISINSLRFYLTPTYRKRVESRPNGKFENQRALVCLDD